MADSLVLSVSALNRYVKSVLDGDINLKTVFVKGQISNFKAHFGSGHYYMTIKDEKAQIRAAMFKNANSRLKFMPENDMSVIIRGRVTLYEQGGEYQLVIEDMQPDGTGALALAFEQLKQRLEKEGIFAEEHKKPIPQFPGKVGVVTSASGAAVRDIINIVERRYPVCEIVIYPVSVQGEGSARQIAEALNYMNKNKSADVIIVGRGGGSIEDLWSFNEEEVALAVYNSEIPVISSVGHETDFTICDFAADLRAPTPSAAAELAVPSAEDMLEYFYQMKNRFYRSIDAGISQRESKVNLYSLSLKKNCPADHIESLMQRIDSLYSAIRSNAEFSMKNRESSLRELVTKLSLQNPAGILAKGYSVVTKGGKTVTRSDEVSAGDKLDIRLNEGSIKCEVIQ